VEILADLVDWDRIDFFEKIVSGGLQSGKAIVVGGWQHEIAVLHCDVDLRCLGNDIEGDLLLTCDQTGALQSGAQPLLQQCVDGLLSGFEAFDTYADQPLKLDLVAHRRHNTVCRFVMSEPYIKNMAYRQTVHRHRRARAEPTDRSEEI